MCWVDRTKCWVDTKASLQHYSDILENACLFTFWQTMFVVSPLVFARLWLKKRGLDDSSEWNQEYFWFSPKATWENWAFHEMSKGQLTTDPVTMSLHLQTNPQLHFGVNGGASQNSRSSVSIRKPLWLISNYLWVSIKLSCIFTTFSAPIDPSTWHLLSQALSQ